MSDYNEKLVLGECSFFLNDEQKNYLQFEERALLDKYSSYLHTAKSEAAMQYFFESNPAFLPGLYDLHNGPIGNIVISKLQLSNEFVTDFAFISVNSAVSQITFIEIESPITQIFRASDDEFSSSFNKAYQQVRDWELWSIQNATHLKDAFRTIYHKHIFRYQRVAIRCILIAGRRSDIRKNPRREKRWASVNNQGNIVVMTYDRLSELFSLDARLLQNLSCRTSRQVRFAEKGAM